MGHEFNFEVVPIAEGLQATEPETEVLPQPVPRVMVVDDEPLIVDSLAAILETAGLDVMRAYNASSALEQAIADPPHLLVTDVAMPGMNGIELAMAVADALPACRVLLFSAHASLLDLTGARLAGFDFPLLSKPIHPRDMLRSVHDSLRAQPVRHRRSHHTGYADSSMPPAWQLPQLIGTSATE